MNYKQHIRIASFVILTLATDITITSQIHPTIGQKRKHEDIKIDAKIESKERTQVPRTEFIKQSVKEYSHFDKAFKLLRTYYSESSIPTFHDFLEEKLYFDDYDDHDLINLHRNNFGSVIAQTEDFIIDKMKNPFCMALEYTVRNHDPLIEDQNKFVQYALEYRHTFMRNIIPYWINSKKKYDKPILHQAINCDNITMVQFLLDLQADLNMQDEQGDTPIHLAIKNNNKPVIQLLLEKDIDVNIPNNKNITPLYSAVKLDEDSIVESLLKKGASVDQEIDDDYQVFTSLWQAVKNSNIMIVDLLLSYGADPNLGSTSNCNLLYTAIQRTDYEASLEYIALGCAGIILEKLLQAGANPNIQIEDEGNITPLHEAVQQNLPCSTKILLTYNANPNITSNALVSPLYIGVDFGSLASIKILIENNTTDLNICGTEDRGTALHAAVKKNYKEIVKLLLDAGADKTIVEEESQLTPLELAETEEMRSLLR
ncbi:ankyrin repeat domain-containing protein [Candidatus Chromulinivorax destructor]|uniref:Peptidase A2 domain-containing protein n=1 Tax=Candidatus Chromulinivorax destructor TaxID=2066483 RepID=A0A345ZC88_9BACT|nr:ankyrin repeat domain-containing protein [Candidatus Chromulinivorax destructor]AXK60905.1 hypothetical protein C0J27_04125 [Candidatus Chromulinivorax destructor]